jgi:hypothetical protein
MTLRDFTILFYDISEYVYIPVAIFSCIIFLRTSQYFSLLLMLIIVTGIRIVSIQMADNNINTMYLYHVIGFVELILVYWLYNKYISKIWKYMVPIFGVLYLFNSLFMVSLNEPNSLGLALVQFIILLFGLNYLKELYQKAEITSLKKDSFFFINSGFIIYAAGSFFVNLMSSKIVNASTNDFFHNAWIMEAGFGIIRLLLITYGLILTLRGK